MEAMPENLMAFATFFEFIFFEKSKKKYPKLEQIIDMPVMAQYCDGLFSPLTALGSKRLHR